MPSTPTIPLEQAQKNLKAGGLTAPVYDQANAVLENYYKNNPAPGSGGSSNPPAKVPRYPSANVSGNDPVAGAEAKFLESAPKPNLDEIESQIRDSMGSEISTIKSMYADMLAKQDITNKQREGRTRASSAAGGVLGTDFGNAEQNQAKGESDAANSAIYNEEMNKLAALDNSALSQGRTIYESRLGTYQGAQKDNIQFRKDAISKTHQMLSSIAATTKLEDLPQAQYDSLYANSGFSTPEEFNAFYDASRMATLQGTKLVGDASTGFYIPQLGSDGQLTYKNVIKPIIKPSQYGAFQFDPSTGDVKSVAPAMPKIVSSGGRIWSIDPTTNKAVALTSASAGAGGKVGWGKANLDQQIAAQSWIEQEAQKGGRDASPYLKQIKDDPDAFLQALQGASEAGIYVPAALSVDSSDAQTAAATAEDAAANAQQAADDAAAGGEGLN